jgi:hypothetical protein
MKTNLFEDRVRQGPVIKNTVRYVTGILHSHRRPVEVPRNKEPDDDPSTRGLTTEGND